jgi:hypothetical protein
MVSKTGHVNVTVSDDLMESPAIRDVLKQVTNLGILLPHREGVAAYLLEHAGLANMLVELCTKVRAAFESQAELSLKRYDDPELEDQYLTLYVRQEKYSKDMIDRIEAVSADLHEQLASVSGYFLITTDFARPRGANGV